MNFQVYEDIVQDHVRVAQNFTQQRFCGMTSRAVHTRHLKNMAEKKQFYKEEWSIRSYRKRLLEVTAAKGGPNSYSMQGFPYFFYQYRECVNCVRNKVMKDYNCLGVLALAHCVCLYL